MSLARFRVVCRADRAGSVAVATVTIDRSAGLFTVRPLRRRRAYTLPLSTVADIVVARIVKAELADKAATRRRRRAVREGRR